MKVNVVVAGLQRSGTTFLEQLLLRNSSNVNILNAGPEGVWKHGYGEEEMKEKIKEKSLFPILIYKHPYTWLDSVHRKKVDLVTKNPGVRGMEVENLCYLYNDFYKWWGREAKYYINYEDLIEDKALTRICIERISAMAGIKLTTPFHKTIIPREVLQSQRFGKAARRKYMNVQVDFNIFFWEKIKEVNRYIDRHLVEALGYSLCLNEEEYETWKETGNGRHLLEVKVR